ncbi:MAG TPA: 50S ribosomal protein L11 methyltransferase [Gemmatimonadaceae bacterium]|nr:50S ribosomal protein L11 methyltransferase [Gemmatimonadaceae bacterium]
MSGEPPRPVHWRTIRVRAEDPEARQAMIAALIAVGAGGVEERGATLITHVPDDVDVGPVHAAATVRPGVRIELEELGPVDWSARWPTQVGLQSLGAITIAPPWLAEQVPDGSHAVIIDPGMAFGTGEHETTRGVVRLMQRVVRPGDAVADLGAGSAVLAIAAAKLGASRVFAIERDEEAIANAEENVRRNHVTDRVVVLHGDAEALLPVVSPVRVLLANIISSVIVQLAPAMRRAIPDDGAVVLSGVLRSERHALLQTLEGTGWRCTAEDAEGDWWSGIVEPA